MKAKVSSPGRRGVAATSDVPATPPKDPPRQMWPAGPVEPGQQWIWMVDAAVLLVVKSWSSDDRWEVTVAGQPVKRTTAQILEGYKLPTSSDGDGGQADGAARSSPARLVSAP
jgi:hypothetical protein